MGNMKANRKFIEGEEAVSAVIGVILMVAITVAIAATVYVYVSGMLTPTTTGKTIGCQYLSNSNQIVQFKVTEPQAGIPWSDVSAKWHNGSCSQINQSDGSTAMTGNVASGDYFSINVSHPGTYTIDLIYNDKIIYTSPEINVS